MSAPIFKVIHVFGVFIDDVLFASCRYIQQHHTPRDTRFQIDVFIQLHVGPEVDELDLRVFTAKTVNTAKTLNDTYRIPVNVVVDERIAILQVLPLTDAVGGYQ